MTNYRTIKVAVATTLWTVSFALGIAGTQNVDIRLLFWAGIAALVACLVTSHVITEVLIHDERLRVEDLVDGLIASAKDTVQAEIRNLR